MSSCVALYVLCGLIKKWIVCDYWKILTCGPYVGSSSSLSGVGSKRDTCRVSTLKVSSPAREDELTVLPILIDDE